MKNYEINKTFANMDECRKWEEENFPNRRYKGDMILMVDHFSEAGKDEVTITNVMVC
jgi:imidazole glycerol phosphate synthase subunit HisF